MLLKGKINYKVRSLSLGVLQLKGAFYNEDSFKKDRILGYIA